MCSFIRKKAMICNSFIAIVAAGIMLTSKGAKSYEMIIVARILHGYTAGKCIFCDKHDTPHINT